MLGITHLVPLGSVSADQVVDDYTPQVGYGPTLRDYPIDGIETIAYNQGLESACIWDEKIRKKKDLIESAIINLSNAGHRGLGCRHRIRYIP